MPPSDAGAGSGHDNLIRDIGKSGASARAAETPESRLMRLAGDPLAVQEIMSQGETSGQRQQVAAPMSGEATITLARSILMHGSLEQASWPQGRMRFEHQNARLEDSVRPTAFEPSLTDREEALEFQSAPPGQASTVSGSPAILAGLTLLALLLLFILQQVPN